MQPPKGTAKLVAFAAVQFLCQATIGYLPNLGSPEWDGVMDGVTSKLLHKCLDRAMRRVSYGLDCNFYDCKIKVVNQLAKLGEWDIDYVWTCIQANDNPPVARGELPTPDPDGDFATGKAPWQLDMDNAISKGWLKRNSQSGFVDLAILLWPLWIMLALFGGLVTIYQIATRRDIQMAKGIWPYGDSCPECGMIDCECHLPVWTCPEEWAGRPAAAIKQFYDCECDPANGDGLDIDLDGLAQVTHLVAGCKLDIDFANGIVYIQTPDGFADHMQESRLHDPDPVCGCRPEDWDTVRQSAIHEFVRYRRGELLPL